MTVVESIRSLFYDRRLIFNNEKQLQDEIAELLDRAKIQYAREFRVGRKCILDFLLIESRTALEIKVKGAIEADIMRQVHRYALLPTISEIIIIALRPFNMPRELNGKPIHVVAIFASII
jgi:hypothetical protein